MKGPEYSPLTASVAADDAALLSQAAVVAHGWSFCRIDGTMASTDARQAEVDKFQAPGAKIPVFLLTTQVRAGILAVTSGISSVGWGEFASFQAP